MHFEHSIDILTQYQKHVVVEKPMVMTLDQGEQLKATAEAQGKKVFPIYQNRFNKAIQRVKRGIDSGELGDLVFDLPPEKYT